MTKPLNHNWRWSLDELRDLALGWNAGETASSIGARLGRSDLAVWAKAKEIGLPRRRDASENQRGRPTGIACGQFVPEAPWQQAAWSGIRFEDDPRAARPDAMQRGLPPLNSSAMTTCAAAMAAGE